MPLKLPAGTVWASVANPKDAKNWVLLRFESKKSLVVAGSGTGGRAECIANLQEEEVMFGGFVVYGVDTRGGVTSQRAKFIHFAWVGSKVPIMHRSRASSMGSAVSGWFAGAHLSFRIDDRADLSEVEIMRKLINTGGAHKPKQYDFGGSLGARTPDVITQGPAETSDGGGASSSLTNNVLLAAAAAAVLSEGSRSKQWK